MGFSPFCMRVRSTLCLRLDHMDPYKLINENIYIFDIYIILSVAHEHNYLVYDYTYNCSIAEVLLKKETMMSSSSSDSKSTLICRSVWLRRQRAKASLCLCIPAFYSTSRILDWLLPRVTSLCLRDCNFITVLVELMRAGWTERSNRVTVRRRRRWWTPRPPCCRRCDGGVRRRERPRIAKWLRVPNAGPAPNLPTPPASAAAASAARRRW